MTVQIRRAAERGATQIDWLDSKHTFSFGDYYDPRAMGFRTLRVINDDRVRPGAGFGTHPHRDMEIVTYVLDGQLEHKDSLGTGSVIRPGDVQRMSAGTGVLHSEFNHSRKDPVHFLQLWIVPEARGIKPSYEQKAFPTEERRGKLRLVASRDGRDGSLTVHQDMNLYAGLLTAGEAATLPLAPGRQAWVHVARGRVELDGQALGEGDGAAVSDASEIALRGVADGEVLVFDLA
jgi:redox-sensitive bicupin YhaK (pirin superfamily)